MLPLFRPRQCSVRRMVEDVGQNLGEGAQGDGFCNKTVDSQTTALVPFLDHIGRGHDDDWSLVQFRVGFDSAEKFQATQGGQFESEEDGDQGFIRSFGGQKVPGLSAIGNDFDMIRHIAFAQLVDEQVAIMLIILRDKNAHRTPNRFSTTRDQNDAS